MNYENRNCALSLLNLLYKEPLYQFIDENSDINVLVLGWGPDNITANFVDLCLQMGQIQNHYLNILVASAEPEKAKETYLASRPALDKFVNVNGSLNELKEKLTVENFKGPVYADLDFIKGPALPEMVNDVESSLNNILNNAGKTKYHYFFISYGDDITNRKIANHLAQNTKASNSAKGGAVHYVLKEKNNNVKKENTEPIFINSITDVEEIDENINRMAFNTHILWGSFLNKDYQKEYKEFKNPDRDMDSQIEYNYSSSVAFAVSVKYKLYDMGISWNDFYEMADAFEEKVSKDENVLNQLIALEHRRWVLEKAETGWRPPEETMEEYCEGCCKREEVKDEDNLFHPCMVRSMPTLSISETKYGRNKIYWDEEGNPEVKDVSLDELDQMSLDLHRAMNHKAAESRKNISIEELKNWEGIHGNKSVREWKRFLFCIENVLDGNYAYSEQYDRYKKDFEKTLKGYKKEEKEKVDKKVKDLNRKIWPAIQTNMYKDYKSNDKTLVRGLSFILTYRTDLTLAMPFKLLDSSEKANSIFENVASPAIIKPKKLIYLLYIDDDSKDNFNKTIKNCYEYLRAKEVNCEINIYIAKTSQTENFDLHGWPSGLNINAPEICRDENEAILYFKKCLKEEKPSLYDGSQTLFKHTKANGEFYKIIKNKYQYFEFDPIARKFRCDNNCRYLTYIKDQMILSEQEMFKLAGAKRTEFNYPFLDNPGIYKTVWGIYTGKSYRKDEETIVDSVTHWNNLCKIINTKEVLLEEKIMKEKIQKDFKKNSETEKESYEKANNKFEEIVPLLNELVNEGLLNERFLDGQRVYSYVDKSIRELFSKEGNVLETCLYYAVCEYGGADYVASGTNIKFTYYNVKNELDLIMIKGFRSLIVECKSRNTLEQDFYHKLNNVANRLGVGTHKALVTPVDVTHDFLEMKNLGESMHIKTIQVSDDICDTVTELINLLNE